MQGRKVFFTLLLALALMGLVSVGTAAASADSSGFSEGTTERWGASQAINSDTLTPTLTVTPTMTPTLEGVHPVGLALAGFFDVSYDEIMSWHESDVGFGNVAKAYFLVDTLGDEELTVDVILGEKLSGTGWGQLMKAFGLSPSSKGRNLGWVMSGRGGDNDDDSDDDADEPEAVLAEVDDGASVGQPDDHPGKGHGPPEKDKDRGKDKIPPGHEKDKKKGKGKGWGKP